MSDMKLADTARAGFSALRDLFFQAFSAPLQASKIESTALL
ncbi:hypothetical protein [Rhizobium sp. BK602]|nr:hypothetical protein [Rhizobium sp. BK602]MBB3612299.1 hypothetical protein [Rhizobium sp. BK602]